MAAEPEAEPSNLPTEEQEESPEDDVKEDVEVTDIKYLAFNSQISKTAYDALQKRDLDRNDDDLKVIFNLASGMHDFDRKPEYTRRELCKVFKYKRFAEGEVVFREGDEPDGFYFILSGHVIGRKQAITEASTASDRIALENISQDTFKLRAGDGFGEGAMHKGDGVPRPGQGKRGATIIAGEDTQMLKVDKPDYEHILLYSYEKELEEKVDFLQAMPLWQGWPTSNLEKVAKAMTMQSLQPNKVIFQQRSDSALAFYLIKKGEVKIVREMTVDMHARVDGKRTLKQVSKLLHVATLGPNDYFGERALLKNTRRTASAITATKVVVYKLPKTEFNAIVASSDRTMRILREMELKYPSDDDLRRAYEEQRAWQLYKKKLVGDIMKDKQNKRELRKYNSPFYSSAEPGKKKKPPML